MVLKRMAMGVGEVLGMSALGFWPEVEEACQAQVVPADLREAEVEERQMVYPWEATGAGYRPAQQDVKYREPAVVEELDLCLAAQGVHFFAQRREVVLGSHGWNRRGRRRASSAAWAEEVDQVPRELPVVADWRGRTFQHRAMAVVR